MRKSKKPQKQKSNEHKSNTKNENEDEKPNKNTEDEGNKEDSPELRREFESLLEQFHALEKKQKEEIIGVKKIQASLQIFVETVYATKEEVKSSICLNIQTTNIVCNSIFGEEKCIMLAEFFPNFGCLGEAETAE